MELGAQTKFDEAADRAVIQGSHNAPDLQKSLDKFIEQFVLCPTCKLPEIKMKVKSSNIKIDCAACGHNGNLATAHKLSQFILKNPPAQKAAKVAGGAHAAAASDAAAAAAGVGMGSVEDVDAKADEAAEEVEKAAAARKKGGAKAGGKDAPEEEVKWFTDTSEDAIKQRKEAVRACVRADGGMHVFVYEFCIRVFSAPSKGPDCWQRGHSWLAVCMVYLASLVICSLALDVMSYATLFFGLYYQLSS